MYSIATLFLIFENASINVCVIVFSMHLLLFMYPILFTYVAPHVKLSLCVIHAVWIFLKFYLVDQPCGTLGYLLVCLSWMLTDNASLLGFHWNTNKKSMGGNHRRNTFLQEIHVYVIFCVILAIHIMHYYNLEYTCINFPWCWCHSDRYAFS